MARAVAFYRDVLGLEATYVSDHWSSVQLGTVRIGLHPVFEGGAPRGGWVVGVEVTDLRAFRKHLYVAGHPTDHEFHQTPSGVVFDFVDPDGNRLQAMEVGSRLEDFA